MADPISEQSIQNLIDGIDRLVRSTERAQKSSGTGIGLSGSDDIFGRSVRDQFDKLIQDAAKFGQKTSRGVAIQRTQQARADRDTSEGVRKANEGIAKSAKTAGTGFARMANNSRLVSDSLLDVGDAAIELTKKLHVGAITASDYAGATKKTIDSVSNLAFMLPGLGKVIAPIIRGFTALAVLAAEQADAQFASYKELQKFGAATSGGVDDVLKMSQAFNIGSTELDKLNALIGQNAAGLAAFRGSVGAGAKDLANISTELTESGFRDKFVRLGIKIDEQNESTAYYIGLQTRLGRAQNMSVAQLASGVAEYVQEQDKLTKATGITRKEQEAARDRAMAQETFRAKIMELEASNQQERADELQLLMTKLEHFGPEIQADLAAMATGKITTEGAGRLQALGNMGGGDLVSVMQDIAAGNINAKEATGQIVETLKQATQAGSTGFGAAQVGAFDKTFGRSFGELQNAIQKMTDFPKRMAKVDVDTDKQDKGDVSPTTANLAAIEASGLELRKQTEQLVQVTVPAVVGALELVATAANKVASKLNQVAGGQAGIDQNIQTVQKLRSGANIDPFTGKTYAKGGIASGPSSGFPATLHGTEAVVPLPDGKTIPVSIQGGMGSGASIDPDIIERTNTELDTFTGFVSKLSKDFAHILRSQSDDISKGPAFGRDDKRLSLEEKSATALIQIKDLLSEAAGIEAPTWMFGGGGAGQRGGATGGFSGGGGGGASMSSMGGGSGISAGGAPSMPSMGGGSGIKVNQQQLASEYGLSLRPSGGDIQAEGAQLNPKLIEVAKRIQSSIPGFAHFTGFNDQFHQERSPSSKHTKGLALDFVLDRNIKGDTKTSKNISDQIKGLGADFVLDEYNNPSAKSTGGHFHVSVPEAKTGGILKGPPSGFPATLHGTEAVVPLPDGKSIPVRMPGMDKITELLGNLPSLLSQSSSTLPLPNGKDMPVRIPGMDTITQMFGSLPSLLSPMIQSVTKMSAPNLPMMSSPGAALSSIIGSIQNPGGANAMGQETSMAQMMEQLTGMFRDGQGGDRGSVELLQQLVSLQRDQNASIVKLIQTSMA